MMRAYYVYSGEKQTEYERTITYTPFSHDALLVPLQINIYKLKIFWLADFNTIDENISKVIMKIFTGGL